MIKRSVVTIIIVLNSIVLLGQDTLRIMSYNIRSGRESSIEAIAKFIKEQNVDIAAIQEVDQWTKRKNMPTGEGANQMAELGYKANMIPIFCKTTDHYTQGYYGLGLLSKFPINKITKIPLPLILKDQEPRAILAVEVDIKGRPFTILNTHVGLLEEDQQAQTKFIYNYFRKIKGAKLICGDFNARPEANVMTKIVTKWSDALPDRVNTYPNDKPRAKIDYMFYDPHSKTPIQVIYRTVMQGIPFSDHCPCVIEVIF